MVPQRLREYFKQLEHKHSIKTAAGQQAWYAKKAEKLQDDMQREYPSTPEETYSQVQVNPNLSVYTAWDLEMNDIVAIWFAQVVGCEVHLVDYLEGEGEGIEHYADLLNMKAYRYDGHFGPHNLAVRELGTHKSQSDVVKGFGISTIKLLEFWQDPKGYITDLFKQLGSIRSNVQQMRTFKHAAGGVTVRRSY